MEVGWIDQKAAQYIFKLYKKPWIALQIKTDCSCKNIVFVIICNATMIYKPQ